MGTFTFLGSIQQRSLCEVLAIIPHPHLQICFLCSLCCRPALRKIETVQREWAWPQGASSSTQHCPYLPFPLFFRGENWEVREGSDSRVPGAPVLHSVTRLSVFFPHWHSPSSSCPAASQPLPPCPHTCLASCLLPSIPLLSVCSIWVFVTACGLSLGAMPFLIAVTSVVARAQDPGPEAFSSCLPKAQGL